VATALVATLTAAPALRAQTIELDLFLTVRRSPDRVEISCMLLNRGEEPALDVQAELRGMDTGPRSVVPELRGGQRVVVAWELDPERWADLRQIAALRVRYHDAAGTWASSVAALGNPTAAQVEGPDWPDRPHLQVSWRDPPPGSAGRVAWWSASELAVEGPERWRAEGGAVTIEATLRPVMDITGWETTAFVLFLPDEDSVPGTVVPVRIDARSFASLWRPDARLLAGWAVLCLSAWAAIVTMGARRGAKGRKLSPNRLGARATETLPPLATALCLGAVALTLLPPRLLFLDTTPAGGDFASHIVAMDELRRELLPNGQIYGWTFDQYAGFPLFLFYFPLAFLVVAFLSLALPLTVAMKVGTLTGALLLPAAWYASLRWLGAPRSALWCAPAAALAFLLVEGQAAWGGSLASLLAGEFAYALGYALAWLALSHAWKTRDNTTGWWPAAVFLALAGLAHGYMLVCAALGIVLLAIHPRLWWRRWWHVARIGLLAFGLLAWWLVPLIWNLPWTNGFRDRWAIGGIEELFPPAVWVAVAILISGIVRRLVLREHPLLGEGQAWLLAFATTLFAAYELGYSLGVVDVRFLPMLHGALLLAGCWELGTWMTLAREGLRPALAAAIIVLISTAAVLGVHYVPSWARWNLNGMERTSRWPDYRGVMRAVSGGPGDTRVAYEHHPDHNAAGTIRAFELLPYFARRATLEGLYFQSAVLAPAVFYLQSELSQHPSCPLPAYECGPFNPTAASGHLRLLGAGELVAYSDSLKRSLARSGDFAERSRSGVYTVFALAGSSALVEPVRVRPVADRYPDWRTEAYDWFRAGTDLDVPLVLGQSSARREPSVARYRPGRLPRTSYARQPRLRYALRNGELRIETDSPGHPLLVKVGFHPGWRASDGSPVELVAPGMMLLTPKSGSLTLSWSAGWAGRLGLLATTVTILLLVLGAVRASRMRRGRPTDPQWRLPEAGRAGWIGIAGLVAAAVGLSLLMLHRHPPRDFAALLAEGQQRLAAGEYARAEESFDRMLAVATEHGLRDDAAFHLGLVALEAGDPDSAVRRWRSFLEEFPVSTYRAESLVRLSELYAARDAPEQAHRTLQEALSTPLGPEHWRAAAQRQLEDRVGASR
jgi:hypothetical protein